MDSNSSLNFASKVLSGLGNEKKPTPGSATSSNPTPQSLQQPLQQQLQQQQLQQQQLQKQQLQQQQLQQQLLNPISNLMQQPPQQQLLGPLTNPTHQQGIGPLHQQGINPMYQGINAIQQLINPTQQLMKNDRNSIFTSSDDNAIMTRIYETHLPDGVNVDVKPLLRIVEDILRFATVEASVLSGPQGQIEHIEDKSHQANALIMHNSYIIDKLSYEMAFRCLSGGDGHTTALALFHTVSNFQWDAKLVLVLAAFALNYGEFWLLAQIYSSNQLARSMAILKQVPMIMEHSAPLRPRFDALNKLIKSIMELTQCIVAFRELPSIYITPDAPAMSSAVATIPTAVYWNIRGVIACAAQIISFTSMGHEYGLSSTELQSWELSTLILKINHILEYLRQHLANCNKLIEEKREIEARKSFHHLFDTIHIDNMKVLKSLIYPRDDILPLFDGSTKRRVSLEVLRRKNVLLLISGIDMSRDELSILEQIYSESRIQGTRMDSLYELVWLPIVDPSVQYTDPMHKQFEDIRSTMPWYSVHHPSLIEKAVIRFIGEKWHFRNKPILVVLDPQGRELSPNALHMMWIWGSNAFPFTSAREEALWREETWRLELLVSGMDPTILNWIKDDKFIILYGGDDIEWIRKFTDTARAMAQAGRISLEMAYVGKSKKREQVRKAIATINVEKLSYCWQDPALMWFFWTRLESMLFSKIQLKRADDQDPMMQEIKKLLSYDKNGPWALFCKGSTIVTIGHGTTMHSTSNEYDSWKEFVPVRGFDMAFKEYHDKLHVASGNCCRFEFPIATGRIPEGMRCPECHRLMDKYIAFLCCHDETGLLEPY